MEETLDGSVRLISTEEYDALVKKLYTPDCEFTEEMYQLMVEYRQRNFPYLNGHSIIMQGHPDSKTPWDYSKKELFPFHQASNKWMDSIPFYTIPTKYSTISGSITNALLKHNKYSDHYFSKYTYLFPNFNTSYKPQTEPTTIISALIGSPSYEAASTSPESASAPESEQQLADPKVKILLSLGFDQKNPNHKWIFIWAEEQPILTFVELLVIALIQRVRSFLDQIAIEDLDNYLSSTELAKIIFDLDTKSRIVQMAIDKGLKNYFLIEGPLPKNPQTKQIEDILNRMALSGPQEFTIVFQPRGAYELKFGTEVIDLSLLLKHADLSQLQLSDDTVQALVEMISKFISYSIVPKGDEVLSKLSLPHRKCLEYYVNVEYSKINEFFRGKKIHTPDVWQYFILGCVITDAVNRLPGLLDNESVFKVEKTILHKMESQAVSDFNSSIAFPMPFISDIKSEVLYNIMLDQARARQIISKIEYSIMQGQYRRLLPLFGYNSFIRREDLTPDDAVRRVSKDSCLTPSLTSTSYGRDVFEQYSHRVVFCPLRTPSISSISSYPDEYEVLLPPGIRVSYVFSGDGHQNLVASIQRSPADYNAYWPEHALSYALEHHLNKDYKERSDTRQIGGITVHRPNHGLPHNYRVMSVLPLLVLHFSNHAVEQTFRNNCRTFTHETLNWLQIAAVFSITGRESEASHSENPERYMNYREACAQHFYDYVQTANPVPGDVEQRSSMIERMRHIILYMGNPFYESQINQHPNPEERALRNHLHRLLSLAHKMDLPRCYSHGQYTQSLEKYPTMVIKSADEASDWYAIQHYLSSLSEAQGDCCNFCINSDGSVANISRSYQPHFGRTSTSLSAIIEVSELVSPPVIRPRPVSASSTLGIFGRSKELQPVPRIHTPNNQGHGKLI